MIRRVPGFTALDLRPGAALGKLAVCASGLLLLFCVLTAHARLWDWQNPLPQGNTINNVAFTGQSLWAVADRSMILHGTDSTDWYHLPYESTADLKGVAFWGENHGWVVGSRGLIRHTSSAGADWSSQVSGTAHDLWDCCFVDSLCGWVVGDSGTVLCTTDGGNNWIPQNSGQTVDLWSVCFVDNQHGWATGWSYPRSPVLRTTNGGQSWALATQFSWPIYRIRFHNALNGWLCGSDGWLCKSTDAGQTWQNVRTDVMYNPYKDVRFINDQEGWVFGPGVRHTTNGGASWSIQPTTGVMSFSCGVFTSAQTGYAFGFAGEIHRTDNAGATWTPVVPATNRDLRSVAFADANHGWAVGGAPVHYTSDGGQTWNKSYPELGEYEWFTSVAAVNPAEAVAVTYEGGLFHTYDGGVNWLRHEYEDRHGLFRSVLRR